MEHPFDRCSQKLLVPPDLKKKPSDFQTEGSLEPSVLNPIGNTAPGSWSCISTLVRFAVDAVRRPCTAPEK